MEDEQRIEEIKAALRKLHKSAEKFGMDDDRAGKIASLMDELQDLGGTWDEEE